jgi:GPH family glycoside/pentoside/hexuronide:cation symporter
MTAVQSASEIPATNLQTAESANAAPVDLVTKLFYGFGSVAYGIKDNGFQTFVLIFYNQLIGLPASWAGGAIFLALIVDAVMDPIVGQMSDHWRSRWGRRHPFMYLAAAPVALSYLALWNPPHWSNGALFAYLVVICIIVRTFITFYEIPSSALAPELTTDYDERTRILGYRYMFGWAGGLGMTFLAYAVFLTPSLPKYPVGQLNPVGYAHYGTVAAIIMFFAILISAAGTHRRIPQLRQPPRDSPRTLGAYFKEMVSTLSHRSFLMVTLGALFSAIGQGVNFAIALYNGTFFWELTSAQILILVMQGFAGAVLAMVIAPPLSKRFGKRNTAIGAMALATVITIAPISLRLLGLFPANHTPALLPTLLAFGSVSSSLGIAAAILIASMISDVVEDSELTTGRRSEGLFFAANSLAQKAVSGTGPLIVGLMLTVVRFPAHAQPGHVPLETLRHLGMLYAPIFVLPYLISIGFLSAYRIDRTTHHDNLRRLADAAALDEAAKESGAPTV